MITTSDRPISVDGVRLDTLAWNLSAINRATAARRAADSQVPGVDGVLPSLNDNLEPARMGLDMFVRGSDHDGKVPAAGSAETFQMNLDELVHLFGKRHALLEVTEQVGPGLEATNQAINPEFRTMQDLTVTNLLKNPSAEANVTGVRLGMVGNIDNPSTLSGAVPSSIRYFRASNFAGPNPEFYFTPGAGVLGFPVVAGERYTFSVYSLASKAGLPQTLYIYYYNAAGVGIGSDNVAQENLPAGDWERRFAVFNPAPAGAAFAEVSSYVPSGILNGDFLYYDAAMVTAGTTLHDYFDGSHINLVTNPDFESNTTGWLAQGNATISRSSTITPVRGVYSMLVTHATAGTDVAAYTQVNGLVIGQQYVFRARVARAAGTQGVGLQVQGATILRSSQGYAANPTSWTELAITFTATAVSHTVAAYNAAGYLTASTGTGSAFYMDVAYVGPIDGTGLFTYAWTGTAHGSASTRTGPFYEYGRNLQKVPSFGNGDVAGWNPTWASSVVLDGGVLVWNLVAGAGHVDYIGYGIPGNNNKVRRLSTVTGTVEVKGPAGLVGGYIQVYGYGGVPAIDQGSTASPTFTYNGDWQTISVTYVLPNVDCRPYLIVRAPGAPDGTQIRVRRSKIEMGAVFTGWADGSDPTDNQFTYSYAATPYGSETVQWVSPVVNLAYGLTGHWRVKRPYRSTEYRVVLEPDGTTTDSFMWGPIPVAADMAGQVMTFMAEVKIPATVPNAPWLQTYVGAPSGSGVYLERASSGAPGTYQLRQKVMIPADATFIEPRLYNGNASPAHKVHWDKVVLVKGDYDGPYFDGWTAGTDLVKYAWVGTPDASMSTRSPAKRRAWAKVQDTIAPDVNQVGSAANFGVGLVLPYGVWEDVDWNDWDSTTLGWSLVGGNVVDVTHLRGATERIADATFLVLGPVTNPRITDPATGAYVQYTGTLANANARWRVNSATWATRVDAGGALTLGSADTDGSDAQAQTTFGGTENQAAFLPLTPTRSNGVRWVRLAVTGTGMTVGTRLMVRARRKFAL